jgi:hypothetical protein
MLDREADPAQLSDQLEFVCYAVTDGEMLDQVSELVERFHARLAATGRT